MLRTVSEAYAATDIRRAANGARHSYITYQIAPTGDAAILGRARRPDPPPFHDPPSTRRPLVGKLEAGAYLSRQSPLINVTFGKLWRRCGEVAIRSWGMVRERRLFKSKVLMSI